MRTNQLQAHLAELAEPRRLLLVDDNKDDCDAIIRITKIFNCDWFVTSSADTAVQTLSGKARDYFSAIVLDLCLPTPERGIDLFRHIAKEYRDIPVMILSGHLDSESIRSICEIDFPFFAQKPTCFNSRYFAKMFKFMDIPKRAIQGGWGDINLGEEIEPGHHR